MGAFIAGEFIFASLADDFGYERVGVFGAHVGIAVAQRVEHIVVVEIFGQLKMPFVAGDGIEVVESFVHTSEFVAKHQTAGFLGLSGQFLVCPFAHFLDDEQRLFVSGIQILVYKA